MRSYILNVFKNRLIPIVLISYAMPCGQFAPKIGQWCACCGGPIKSISLACLLDILISINKTLFQYK
jgi:predicted amidophosphoribosyltransferase